MNLTDLILDPNATIVDVREPFEFMSGHVEGSTNLPLGEVPGKVEALDKLPKPLVLICASGNRSGQAARFLADRGVKEVYNGGGWYDVHMLKMSAVNQ
jgi:phage shock protein E